ncbi:DUF5906 domain-containing protein (plasmid) [Exiguobacterium mexicanum]|uniref:DUF5906 domain-containing protein n=1 Tax=Exiguobacterium mexicanum TaxID=340146 RepID=UPI003AB7174D
MDGSRFLYEKKPATKNSSAVYELDVLEFTAYLVEQKDILTDANGLFYMYDARNRFWEHAPTDSDKTKRWIGERLKRFGLQAYDSVNVTKNIIDRLIKDLPLVGSLLHQTAYETGGYMNFKNGVFNPMTGVELTDPQEIKRKGFRFQLGVNYTTEPMKSEELRQFIESINVSNEDETLIRNLARFIFAAGTRTNLSDRFLFFYGQSGCGKSTLGELLSAIIGDGAKAVEWSVIRGDTRILSTLEGRGMIFVDESSSEKFDDTNLKRLTTHTRTVIDKKFAPEGVEAQIQAQVLVCGNNLLKPSGGREGLERRVSTVVFHKNSKEFTKLVRSLMVSRGGKAKLAQELANALFEVMRSWPVFPTEYEVSKAGKNALTMMIEQTDDLHDFVSDNREKLISLIELHDELELLETKGYKTLYDDWAQANNLKKVLPQSRLTQNMARILQAKALTRDARRRIGGKIRVNALYWSVEDRPRELKTVEELEQEEVGDELKGAF